MPLLVGPIKIQVNDRACEPEAKEFLLVKEEAKMTKVSAQAKIVLVIDFYFYGVTLKGIERD